MTNLRFIGLAILLAVPFAYYVDPSIYEAAFIEVSDLLLLGLHVFGLFFAGITLIYSLFWLDRIQILSYLRKIFILVIAFELLAVGVSYFLINFLSFDVMDFQVHAAEAVDFTKQDILGRISPFFLMKHPSILWFAICFITGLSLPKFFSNRFQMNAFLTVLMSTMKQIFHVIETFAAIPIFFLIVLMLRTFRSDLSFEMVIYLLAYLSTAFVFIFYLIPLVWSVRAKASAVDFYRLMLYPSIFAFGFGDVATALPIFFFLLDEVKSNLNDKEKNEAAGFIIPTTYTFFPIANSLLLIIPLLVLKVTGQSSGYFEHLNYIGVGLFVLATPTLAGYGAVSILFDLLKLPQDSTGIYVEIYPIMRHFHALINSFSIGFIFLYLIAQKDSWKTFGFKKAVLHFLKYGFLLLIGLIVIYFGSQTISNMKEKGDIKTLQELRINQPGATLDNLKKQNVGKKVRSLQEIIQSKVLRVGYQKNAIPFSYENIQGEIVGFDIEIAHLIAKDLNSSLQLIPMDYKNVTEMLISGEIDIAMGALSVTTERLKKINFSQPVIISEKVLVVKDYERYGYDEPEEVIADKDFRVAFLKGSSFEEYAKEMFPNAQYVPLKSYDEFLESNIADALFWSRQEAFHWTLIHPNYTMVSLKNYPPPNRDILAFGIAYEADEVAPFVDHWLILQENNQVMSELRDKWQVPASMPEL